MAKETIRVVGLKQLARGFHKLSGELASELDVALLEAAKLVEVESQQLIRQQRLTGGPRSTGRLSRFTKAFLRPRTGVAGVRSGATRTTGANAPFNYPRVWEFGHGRARAFLWPALERTRPAVIGRLDRMLDELAGDFNRGGRTP